MLRRWWLVLGIALVVAGVTYALQARKPVTYTASTSVFLQSSPIRNALGEPIVQGDPTRVARNEATLLQSREVAAVVARDIGYEGDPRALLGSISANPIPDADFLQITATAGSGADAAELANGFARGYVRVRGADAADEARAAIASLQGQVDAIPDNRAGRGQRTSLLGRIERLRLVIALPASSARQFEVAEPPTQANGTPAGRSGFFGLAVGLVLGVGAAYALEALGRRIKWSGDVESLYDQPLLTQLPHARAIGAGTLTPSPDLVEGVRTLRTNLQLKAMNGSGAAMRSILVTSAVSGEGKSTVARHLAMAYREAGATVAVVDADLRRSSLTRDLGLADGPGLVEVLSGAATLDHTLRLAAVAGSPDRSAGSNGSGAPTGPAEPSDRFAEFFGPAASARTVVAASNEIMVLAAGQASGDPAATLGSDRMGRMLSELSERFEVIIVDSAPLLPVSDTLPLLHAVDGVLVTTRLGVTTRSAAQQLSETLKRVPGCETLGVVANDVRVSEGLPTYGYESADPRPRRLRRR